MADEQVGNNSWITMTPGSAVAGQLQNILTAKRLEARQAMMDALDAKDKQSLIDYRAENAKSLAADRASKEADRQAQELTRRTSVMSPHMPIQGSDLEYLQANAPSLVDPGQEGTKPLDYQAGEQGPEQPAKPPTFHGLPKQLEEETKKGLQDKLMAMMSDPTKWDGLPDAQKEALYRNAFGASIPENVLRPKTGGKVFFADEDSKQLIDAASGQRVTANSVGANDKIVNIPHKPIGPAAPAPTYWQGEEVGPDGTTAPAIYRSGRDNAAPERVQFPPTFRIGGKAGVNKPPTPGKPVNVPQKSWDEFLALKSALADPTKAADPKTLGPATTQAKHLISLMSKDPTVQDFLNSAWDHPLARREPVESLLAKAAPVDPKQAPLTPAQKSEITSIWRQLQVQ